MTLRWGYEPPADEKHAWKTGWNCSLCSIYRLLSVKVWIRARSLAGIDNSSVAASALWHLALCNSPFPSKIISIKLFNYSALVHAGNFDKPTIIKGNSVWHFSNAIPTANSFLIYTERHWLLIMAVYAALCGFSWTKRVLFNALLDQRDLAAVSTWSWLTATSRLRSIGLEDVSTWWQFCSRVNK